MSLVTSVPRRFQVFVSSTFKDLAEERKQAIEVIFERGHIPIDMARFAASDESDLKVIRMAIEDCQIYLTILGHRYGELVPDGTVDPTTIDHPGYDDMSYTELEYSLAQKHGLYTIVLAMEPDLVARNRRELDPNTTDGNRELGHHARLERFRSRLQKHSRQYWTPEKFRYQVLKALDDNLPTCGRRGFIREPADPTFVETSKNAFIVEIVDQLKSFDKLYERCSAGEEEMKKKALAEFFRAQYVDRMLKFRTSLFFESGSTVAYVAKALSARLAQEVHIEENGEPTMAISTNNVLAYLSLWLRAKVPCSPFPWSPPREKRYGAWYGGLEEKENKPPSYDLRPLDDTAKQEIEKLMSKKYRPIMAMDRPSLLLGAASGLQMSPEHKPKLPAGLDDGSLSQWIAKLAGCYGPHVGSYHNKVFKRFMYATKIPLVLFLSSDKIDCEIDVERCHFILDSELTWEGFRRDHPLAICVGCLDSELSRLKELFISGGFDIIDAGRPSRITAFIARNAPFVAEFENWRPPH